MFYVQERRLHDPNGVTWGVWLSLWESTDGADCAHYLQRLVETDKRTWVEYRMVYARQPS